MMIVIVLCCYQVGYSQACKLMKRVKLLNAIENMLIYIKNNISYMAKPVGEILFEMSESREFEELDFIEIAAKKVGSGQPVAYAFSQGVKRTQLELEQADKELLTSFGSQIGSSDIDGELGKIEFFKEQVKLVKEEAREKRDKTAKLYTSLGIFAGLALVLILL